MVRFAEVFIIAFLKMTWLCFPTVSLMQYRQAAA
jgi:hypothetical protein